VEFDDMKVISAEQVRSLLSMSECIEAMATAMTAVSRGDLVQPSRMVMPLFDNSAYFGLMPGSLADPLIYGAKVVSLHPKNAAAGKPVIQGFVALFDHEDGRPLALVDGAEITALRTAAASGLATRLLARPDASSLGLFGHGIQARAHIEAICAVREIEEIRVWGRSPERVSAFVQANVGQVQAKIIAASDPAEAASCDILCTVTAAGEPILRSDWVAPGTHINLVGSHSPTTREADTSLIVRGRLYVDAFAAAWNEAGDILIPIDEGAIDRSHVLGEIGEVALGRVLGRSSRDDITIYKSLGAVAQDLVAAHAVYSKAGHASRT
jgi:ornithine cyclodeaminase